MDFERIYSVLIGSLRNKFSDARSYGSEVTIVRRTDEHKVWMYLQIEFAKHDNKGRKFIDFFNACYGIDLDSIVINIIDGKEIDNV